MFHVEQAWGFPGFNRQVPDYGESASAPGGNSWGRCALEDQRAELGFALRTLRRNELGFAQAILVHALTAVTESVLPDDPAGVPTVQAVLITALGSGDPLQILKGVAGCCGEKNDEESHQERISRAISSPLALLLCE